MKRALGWEAEDLSSISTPVCVDWGRTLPLPLPISQIWKLSEMVSKILSGSKSLILLVDQFDYLDV